MSRVALFYNHTLGGMDPSVIHEKGIPSLPEVFQSARFVRLIWVPPEGLKQRVLL